MINKWRSLRRTGLISLTILVVLGIIISCQKSQLTSYQALESSFNTLKTNIDSIQTAKNIPKQELINNLASIKAKISSLAIDNQAKLELNQLIKNLETNLNQLPQEIILTKDKLSLDKELVSLEKDINNTQNSILGTWLQFLGSLFFIATLLIGWANYKATQDKQIAERFSKAVELLGEEDKISCRLGGIYAMEQIADDSSNKYHWVIVEVLASFIRQQSPKDNVTYGSIKPDVQAALAVIINQYNSKAKKNKILNLSSTYLANIDWRDANLQNILFEESVLKNCFFQGTNLRGANFKSATLETVKFQDADLQSVVFENATLENVDFTRADLAHYNFNRAKLINVNFRLAKNVKQDDLRKICDEVAESVEF